MGRIEAICLSQKKGMRKTPVTSAEFVADKGITGDGHFGFGHRQVSILSAESIDRVREKMPSLKDGAFAENLVVRDWDLEAMRVGDVLRLGDEVLLEVTQIGKECHRPCIIQKQTGDCIMPREGIFAKVVKGGVVKCGDEIELQSTAMPSVARAGGLLRQVR